MQEIENINVELMTLGDMLARMRNRELSDMLEDDLPLRRTVWQRTKDQEEMQGRFDFLNSVLLWWAEQTTYVFDRVKGPEASGFRAPSQGDGPPQSMALAQNWQQSAKTLLRRLDGQALERALKTWIDDLVGRGMLSEVDAAGVQFEPPRDEHLAQRQADDQERLAQFRADLERVLLRVEEVAEKRGQHPGLPHRQALGLYNRKYHHRFHDRQLLGEFVRDLAHEGLLPRSYATMRSATDAVKNLLGGI